MERPISDRRGTARIRSVELVSYSGERHGEPSTPISMARTLDLSATGVRLEVRGRLEEGDTLWLEIASGESISCAEARVVHVRASAANLFEVGTEFTSSLTGLNFF